MYYEIHGEGEPLVYITGAGGNTTQCYGYIPVYSREYRLILFDSRGAGQSDAPDMPYTMEIMADDLAGLLDTIGINASHIWGVSMGGMIAQQFALRYPEKVRSLILACTYCGGPGSSLMTDPEVMRATERMQGLPLKESMMEMLRLMVSQKFIDDNPGLIREMVEQMTKHPAPPHGRMRQTEAAMAHNTYERLPEIKAPTLVIHGDADKLINVENSRIIASRIPGAELVILKNMGHLFALEAEDESNRITLDFLRRHSATIQ